ncbi:MAG TPA: hypothetical protein VFN53_13065 [Acidobacteriaceae bacterium]|nr:hypothetical protein [Acidobacteriaceae bacterium]
MTKPPATTPVQDSVSKVNDEIAVGEDLKFQRKWWRFERIIWVLFAIIVALDLSGAFGRGYLANSRMRASDHTMDVKYEHIERFSTSSILKIRFGPAAIHDGKIKLYVSQSFVSELGNRRIIPQPESSEVAASGIVYTFPANSYKASVAFALQPSRPGLFPIALQVLPGGEQLRSKVFVMP